eukprot:1160382-Pelagomonas_calceolata.AAC.17
MQRRYCRSILLSCAGWEAWAVAQRVAQCFVTLDLLIAISAAQQHSWGGREQAYATPTTTSSARHMQLSAATPFWEGNGVHS